MARVIVKGEFDLNPMGNHLMKREPYPCPHFGGNCLGDGCVNWTPIGSPPRQQNGQRLIERAGEPVHHAECLRKAANAERWVRHSVAYAVEHNARGSYVNAFIHRYTAADWRRMAETAPERAA